MGYWTAERVADLKTRWANGETGGEIAKAFGCTKNVIIGKVHRLGIQHSVESFEITRALQNKSRKRKPLPKIVEPVVIREPQPAVAFSPAIRQCQWPIGTPGEPSFSFCGCKAEIGRPYCADHVAVAFVPATPKLIRSQERLLIRYR